MNRTTASWITAYRAAYALVGLLVLGAIGLTVFEAVVAPRLSLLPSG